MKPLLGVFFLLAIGLASPGALASGPTEADLGRFVSWWAGDYDNWAQVKAQTSAGVPEKERNQPTLLFIRKVDLPAFGDAVFYAEWQNANDPSKIIRQRLYAFLLDRAQSKIRLNLHIWPNDKPEFVARTIGAHLDPTKLKGVTLADMAQLSGCDVFFDLDGQEFTGAMIKRACAFPAPNGNPIYSWSQMKLSATQFKYLDGWFNLDDTVFQRMSSEWYVFDKKK